MYYTKPGPRGRALYFHAGEDGKKKMVSIKDIPEAVQIALQAGTPEVDENALMETTEVDTVDRGCVFCGVYSNWQRLVNGQTVHICEEHYHTTTIGQIAAKLREKDNEGHGQTEERDEEKENDEG